MFGRFVQADDEVHRSYGGSGLGLALCAELVRLMGGKLDVRSEVGRGSAFSFALPLRAQSRPRGPEAHGLEGVRVLVADDDPAEREVVAKTLRAVGAEVASAGDLEGARTALVAAARAGRPVEVAVLDCRMPGGGGIDLARWLRARPRELPCPRLVVLLPMDHRPGDPALCAELGAVPILKPPRRDVLRSVVSDGRAPASPGAGDRDAIPSLAGLRVLVAEDAPENSTLILAYLRRAGCRVTLVSDGAQALGAWRKGRFDIVLMDMHMPRMDGFEAARQIREEESRSDRPRTPIVAVTAHAFGEERKRCLAAGCDAHVAKPIERGRLFQAIVDLGGRPAGEGDAARGGSEAAGVPPELAALAGEYLASRGRDVEALRDALERADWDRVYTLGHNMKGSGLGYGFPRVSEIGAGIQAAAEGCDRAEAERKTAELEAYLSRAALAGR